MGSTQKKCPECGTMFNCGISDSDDPCWCSDYPAIFPPANDKDCLCSDCLIKATITKINQYINSLTPAETLNNKAKDLPKTKTLIEGIDFYEENNNYVFTAWYHLKRGNCCKNDCRHCPYELKK